MRRQIREDSTAYKACCDCGTIKHRPEGQIAVQSKPQKTNMRRGFALRRLQNARMQSTRARCTSCPCTQVESVQSKQPRGSVLDWEPVFSSKIVMAHEMRSVFHMVLSRAGSQRRSFAPSISKFAVNINYALLVSIKPFNINLTLINQSNHIPRSTLEEIK